MEVITFGERKNPCVVFLHGWGGGFSSFSFFAKALSDNFFCVVVDFNSLIQGDKVLKIDDFKDCVLNYLKENQIDSASFVAHSFGGRVVAKIAECDAKILEKVVLIDSAGLRPRRNLWYYIKVRWFKFQVKLAKLHLVKESKLKKYGSADYVRLPETQKQTFKNIVNTFLEAGFANINSPTLIYWGEKDYETPLFMAKKLKRLIKNSEIIIEKDVGHFSYLKNPAKFIKILTIFLEEKDE